MEKQYYVGNMTSFNDINITIMQNMFNYNSNITNMSLCMYLYNFGVNEEFRVDNNEVFNYIDKQVNRDKLYSNKHSCIFEIIEDENNFKYAKEMYTGLIFPIVNKEDLKLIFTGKLLTATPVENSNLYIF